MTTTATMKAVFDSDSNDNDTDNSHRICNSNTDFIPHKHDINNFNYLKHILNSDIPTTRITQTPTIMGYHKHTHSHTHTHQISPTPV